MRYTENMEPTTPKMRAMLNSELVQTLESGDIASLHDYLQKFKSEESSASKWAEAIGTRLQIRDFLLEQKGGVAALSANHEPDLSQNVTNFLRSLDTSLAKLTGEEGQDRPQISREQLKSNRIDRLIHEPDGRLIELTNGFSNQDSNRVLSAEELLSRTVDIRNDLVERIWPAAQSYQEGNLVVAQHELATELAVANQNLDSQITTVLQWEEAA